VLTEKFPSYAAVGNPVDTTAAILAQKGLFDSTLLQVCRDPGVALTVLPIAIAYGSVTVEVAEAVLRVQAQSPVPILPIWMSDRTGEGFDLYARHGIVPARSVGKAAKAIRRWIDHGRWRRRTDRLDWQPWPSLGQTPAPGPALRLTEQAAKQWLARHGVPVPASALATSRDEAMAVAQRLGFPVVAKVASADIAHKTEVGGVAIGLADAAAVGAAWDRIHASVQAAAPQARVDGLLIERMAGAGGVEVLVGVSRDPVFGPVLTFGLGGIHVELFQDVARRLLPLTRAEAERMVREPRSFALLDGARGRPKADVTALVDLLLAVSDFVGAQGDRVDEIDLNPLWVGPAGRGVLALDAVVVGRGEAAA
jgi:acyl-CoA synthetase (NDP forming)